MRKLKGNRVSYEKRACARALFTPYSQKLIANCLTTPGALAARAFSVLGLHTAAAAVHQCGFDHNSNISSAGRTHKTAAKAREPRNSKERPAFARNISESLGRWLPNPRGRGDI